MHSLKHIHNAPVRIQQAVKCSAWNSIAKEINAHKKPEITKQPKQLLTVWLKLLYQFQNLKNSAVNR